MQPANAGPKILFIDDDDDLAFALCTALASAGYRVRRAADGEAGLQMAREEKPDLILLDWMMPVKDGFRACTELRAIESLSRVPILALTAFGQNIGEVHGMSLPGSQQQVQGCLEKPVEINVLLHTVARFLQSANLSSAS
jgi:DNA-binding response OmpR family regulator